MKKRFLCLFLVLTMLFTFLPERFYNAFAGLVSAEEEKKSETEPKGDEVLLYLVTNGGTISDKYAKVDTVKKGKEIELPSEDQISRDGYIFDGWYDNSDYNGDALTKATAGDDELNFYAKWIPRYFTISIPDTAQLDASGKMNISADCHGFYENDKIEISVSSQNEWKLEKDGTEVNYNILDENGQAVKNDGRVAVFEKTGKTDLNYSVENADADKISDAEDKITFKVNLVTTQYTVTFDTKGGNEMESAKFDAGTLLMDLPAPSKEGETFISWCLDESCTDFVKKTDELTKDTKLYAYYLEITEQELEGYTWCAHAYNQGTDYEIKLSTTEKMTTAQVLEGITVINATEPDNKDFFTITGSNKNFVIKGKNGFRAGSNYKITIEDERIQFADYSAVKNPPTELDFSIYKDEVVNVTLSNKIKYIPINNVTELYLNGEHVNEIKISAIKINTESEYASVTSIGHFTYNGSLKLNVGDTVGIYEGSKPTGSKAETILSDPMVSFVEITSIEKNVIFYRGADVKNVLFTPDVFPIPESADTDGSKTNLSAKISEKYFIYTDGSMSAYGLDVDTTVDVGDFAAFYTGTLNKTTGKGITVTKYVQITSVSCSSSKDGVFYTIGFKEVSYDNLLKSMDTYYKRDVSNDEYDALVDKDAVESALYESAQNEEFSEAVEDYLFTSLIVSDEFKETLEENNIDPDSIEVVKEFRAEEYTNEQLASNPRVEVAIKIIKPYISKDLQYFKGKEGLRVTLEVGVEVCVHFDTTADIKFTVTTELQQEIRITIGADAQAVWDNWGPIPILTDYKVTTTTDLYEYTGLGLEINVSTDSKEGYRGTKYKTLRKAVKAAADVKEMYENITESIGKITGDEKDEAMLDTLPEKYAELIEAAGELEWVDVYEINVFEAHFELLYIIDISVAVDVVFSLKMNVSIGVEFYYAAAKRYIFNVDVFGHSVTNESTDLEPEVYQFTFYAMGVMGIRAGVQLRIEIGIISTELDSVGITVRVGVYVEVYGYFYYVYKNSKMNGVVKTTSDFSGALFIELGAFVNIKFIAQIGSNALRYELELFDKQWPIVEFGEQKNVVDFSWDQENLDELDMKFAVTRAYLPDDLFEVEYLDLKEGADSVTIEDEEEVVFFKERYEYDDFDIVITDSRFEYDHELNRIIVTPNEGDRYIDGEMIITYKAPLTVTKKPIQRRIKLHWDDLATGYIITFESQGGTYLGIIEGRYGMEIKAPSNPVKEGYTFTGWYMEPECKTKASVPATMPAGNLTLYAGWTAAEVSYKIEYYQEALNGTYELAEYTIQKAMTGAIVKSKQKNYEGFSTPASQELKVTADGSAVTRYYYSRNSYEITFESGNANNEVYKKTFKYGETIVPPSFGMVGYDFSGWDKEIPSTMPANNITVKGSWAAANDTEYSVRYYLQNAEGEGYTLGSVLYQKGTTATTVTAPIASFVGYTVETEKVTGVILPDGSLTLDVYYRRNVYSITYETNGGSELENQNCRFGASVYSERTTRADYAFVGWYTDIELKNEFDGKMPSTDIILYAAWKLGTGYTIYHHWMDDKGNMPTTTTDIEYKYVQEDEVGKKLTIVPKTAEGFETIDSKTVSISTDTSNPTEIHFYYPRRFFSLYLDYNDGNGVQKTTLFYGTAVKITPEREGYAFAGWYENAGLTVEANLPETMPLHDVTLYAKWKKNGYKVEYILNGGKLDSSVNYDSFSFGETVTDPKIPTRSGYAFEGWYTDKELTQKYTKPETMPAKNITLYANWSVVTYKIEYVLDGGTNDSKNPSEYTVESNNITIYQPKKTNYNFNGWNATISYDGVKYESINLGDIKTPTIKKGTYGKIKLTAKFTGVDCTIAFNLDATENVSSTPGNITVQYNNTPANLSSVPTRSGYTFDGFYNGNTKIYDAKGKYVGSGTWKTTGTVTLKAKWTSKTYTINFASADGNKRTNLTSMTVKFSDATVTLGNTTSYTLATYKLGYCGSINVRYRLIGFSTKSSGIEVQYEAGKEYKNTLNNENFYDSITLYEVSYITDITIEMADTWDELINKGGIPVDDGDDKSNVWFYFNKSGTTSISFRNGTSPSDGTKFTAADINYYKAIPARDFQVLSKYATASCARFSFELTHKYDFDPDITIYSISNSGTETKKWSDSIGKCTSDKSISASTVGDINFSWSMGKMDLAGFKIHFESDGGSDDTYFVESCRLYITFSI